MVNLWDLAFQLSFLFHMYFFYCTGICVSSISVVSECLTIFLGSKLIFQVGKQTTVVQIPCPWLVESCVVQTRTELLISSKITFCNVKVMEERNLCYHIIKRCQDMMGKQYICMQKPSVLGSIRTADTQNAYIYISSLE